MVYVLACQISLKLEVPRGGPPMGFRSPQKPEVWRVKSTEDDKLKLNSSFKVKFFF